MVFIISYLVVGDNHDECRAQEVETQSKKYPSDQRYSCQAPSLNVFVCVLFVCVCVSMYVHVRLCVCVFKYVNVFECVNV